MTAKDRAKLAWRAFSVHALAALATQPVWYPVVAETAKAALGDHAEAYVQAAVAVAGILGWIKPQTAIQAPSR